MGQKDIKPTANSSERQSLLKGYNLQSHFPLHHLSNEVQVYNKRSAHYLCINKFEMQYRSTEILYEINSYYRERMRLGTQSNLIAIHYVDVIDRVRCESVREHLEQFGVLPDHTTKVDVNTACSLNIFQQNCRKNIANPRSSSVKLQLQLYQQYMNCTLQGEVESRKKINHLYSEKQLWSILECAVRAGHQLVSKGFKQPLLSPVAIKLDEGGKVLVGEWQFCHFFQDHNEEVDQDTNFFQQGEAYLRDTSRISDRVSKGNAYKYNILTSYYWAPEGTAAMQNAVTLGRWKKVSSAIKTSRMSVAPNSQIFSLGMTLLHLCLLRPLYQEQTYSQKKIKKYIEEAQRCRIKDKVPLSNEFIAVINQMLRWSPEDRIGYASLYEQVQGKRTQRPTVFSIYTNEVVLSQSEINESKVFAIHKEVEGSGSVDQGSGDVDHPVEQQLNRPGPLSVRKQLDCNLDYGKVDFTIRRERKQWERFQNRLLESEYKITAQQEGSNNKMALSSICGYTHNRVRNNNELTLSAEMLVRDEQDMCNEQNLCKMVLKQDEIGSVDRNAEDVADVGLSGISDSIRILDISNINAGQEDSVCHRNESKQLAFNFNGEQSCSKIAVQKRSFNLNNSYSDSLFLKSCVVHEQTGAGVSSNKDDNLFTPPEFLDFIRMSCLRQPQQIQQAKVKEEKNEQHNSIEGELTNSTFVKQSFAKGCYEGGKVDGLRNGYGTFYYNEGGKYCGDWQNNQMHGKGTLYYADGRIAYQGQWKFDSLNGKGILYNQNPAQLEGSYDYRSFDESEDYWVYYEGSFHQDDKWGNGVLLLSNGERFEGFFKEDCIEGKGTFYGKEGLKVVGEWMSNKLVRVISECRSPIADKI